MAVTTLAVALLGFAGMQLRVHDERGEWVGSAGVRELGGTATPPVHGRFRIGSNTKTFVATVVLQLVAEGPIGLDDSVNGYQPEELVRFALAKPALFAPGTDWNYSNTGYTLAALLIEKITGRSYAEEMRRRILRPLGLRGTVVPGTRTGIPGPHATATTATSTPVNRRRSTGCTWRTRVVASPSCATTAAPSATGR